MFRRNAQRILLMRGLASPCALSLLQRPQPSMPVRTPRFTAVWSGTPRRLYATGGGRNNADDVEEFEFDPMASVRHDAAVESAKESVDDVIDSLVPANATAAAREKVRQYLAQHPVDVLVVADEIQITHMENPETGAEEKVNLSPCSREEALEQARLRHMNLVQMGARENTAFCRLRNETPWVAKLIAEEMKSAAPAPGGADAAGAAGAGEEEEVSRAPPRKTLPQKEHIFRDVVDAHFVGWKSKKICEDVKRGHPVKLTIKDFQTAESAVLKLREMCLAIQKWSEEKKIPNHFTSIVANDRECSITLSPPTPGNPARGVKHPGEKEWTHTLKRMEAACEKAGRAGTYAKTNKLKPRNVGSSLFRVDKYGRRVE